MEMEQIEVDARDDGSIWLHQEDGTSDGASIKLNAEQIPLLCRWLLDAADVDIHDIPPKRQSVDI